MHSLPIYINYVCVRFRKSVNDRSFWTSDNSGIKFQQQNQQVYRYFSIYIVNKGEYFMALSLSIMNALNVMCTMVSDWM